MLFLTRACGDYRQRGYLYFCPRYRPAPVLHAGVGAVSTTPQGGLEMRWEHGQMASSYRRVLRSDPTMPQVPALTSDLGCVLKAGGPSGIFPRKGARRGAGVRRLVGPEKRFGGDSSDTGRIAVLASRAGTGQPADAYYVAERLTSTL